MSETKPSLWSDIGECNEQIIAGGKPISTTPRYGNPPSRTNAPRYQANLRRGVKESGVARRRARLAGKERSKQTSSHRPRRTLARAFQI
jgi:hypothetical protein